MTTILDHQFYMDNRETFKERCNYAIDAFTRAANTLEQLGKNHSKELFDNPLEVAEVLLDAYTDIEKGLFDEKPNFDQLIIKADSAKTIQKTQFKKMVTEVKSHMTAMVLFQALVADFHLRKHKGFTKQALLDIHETWQEIVRSNQTAVADRAIEFDFGYPAHLAFIQVFDIAEIDIFGELDDDEDMEEDIEENRLNNLLFRSFWQNPPHRDFSNEPSISEVSVDRHFAEDYSPIEVYLPIEKGEFCLFEAERKIRDWGLPPRRRSRQGYYDPPSMRL